MPIVTQPPLPTFGSFRRPDGTVWRPGSAPCNDNACVALAHGPGGWVAVMDTKTPDREPLFFTAIEWRRFLDSIRPPTNTRPGPNADH